MIKKDPSGGYNLYTKNGKKKLSHHSTREDAMLREKLIKGLDRIHRAAGGRGRRGK